MDSLSKKLRVMKQLGVPYTDDQIQNAVELAETQAKDIKKTLESQGATNVSDSKEIIALIAYLQTLKPLELR